MFKKWHAINQSVITSGCLQLVYFNGSGLENGSMEPIKAYAEHLDVIIVFDGELSIKTFSQKLILKSGDVFFYTRSTYSEFSVTSESVSGVRLRFIADRVEGSSLRRRFAASMLGSGIINQKLKNHCLTYIKLIDSSVDSISKSEVLAIQSESLEILNVLTHMIESEHELLDIISHDLKKNEIVVDAINMFESNLKNTPKIRTIVEQLGVSHSYFVRTFKRSIGVPPSTFARTLKVNCSLSLISSDPDSLSDVSYFLGFSDQSHFSNSFRDVLHFTPGVVAIRTIE